jgi:hypothetical protein
MDLFLDVERRRVYHQLTPILLVLAAPDELRIEISVAHHLFLFEPAHTSILSDFDGLILLLLQNGLVFGSRNIFSFRFVVLERFNSLLWRCLGHGTSGVKSDLTFGSAFCLVFSNQLFDCIEHNRKLFVVSLLQRFDLPSKLAI